jgi:hypothetical protein
MSAVDPPFAFAGEVVPDLGLAATEGFAFCRAAARISAVESFFPAVAPAPAVAGARFVAAVVALGAGCDAEPSVPQISRTLCKIAVIDGGRFSAGLPLLRTASSRLRTAVGTGGPLWPRFCRTCCRIDVIASGVELSETLDA